ncbi:MAG: hypothetical protein JWR42_1202 [Marmoricola sp.]|nr:hypothetical protein [Marmoricola sp.]
MRRSRFKAPLLALGVVAASLGTVATTAAVAEATVYSNCLYFRSGSGCATTSRSWVNDRTADGYSVVLHYKAPGLPYLSLWDHNGAGNGRTYENTSTASRAQVSRVQLCKGVYSTGRTFACSAWHTP